MNRIFNSIVLCASAIATMSCGGRTVEKTAIPQVTPVVITEKAAFQDVEQSETYSSSVVAFATNNIAPQAGLRIRKIKAEIGDYVQAGQILAEMDKSQLEQARLKLMNDSTELSRLKGLYEAGGLSQSDYDAVELAYRVSRSSYQNLLENTILRAPITGVVTARNYDREDLYTMGQPVFTVQQITPVKLLVAVSESDYTKVHKGDAVSLTVDAIPDRTFAGTINRIYPTMDASTHTFTVEVKVANADRTLRPGMYAKVKITFGINHSIVVKDVAVLKLEGSGKRYVYVVENGLAIRKFVTLGRHFNGCYEILSGIEEGDNVIIKGNSSLRGGETVEVR